VKIASGIKFNFYKEWMGMNSIVVCIELSVVHFYFPFTSINASKKLSKKLSTF